MGGEEERKGLGNPKFKHEFPVFFFLGRASEGSKKKEKFTKKKKPFSSFLAFDSFGKLKKMPFHSEYVVFLPSLDERNRRWGRPSVGPADPKKNLSAHL